jgi:pimeloyl-ACP methyl ester carboxylesterase
MDNLRRARFKSGAIPQSDALLRALPDIRARITAAYRERDAFVGAFIEDRRRVLTGAQPGVDFRVVRGAGHWLIYEAAGAVNAVMQSFLGPAGGDSYDR